jgi:hypothetical protein
MVINKNADFQKPTTILFLKYVIIRSYQPMERSKSQTPSIMNQLFRHYLKLLPLVGMLSMHANAAQIFITNYPSEANAKVFVTKYPSEANCIVYETRYSSDNEPGVWFYTKYKSDARASIYYTQYKSEADLIVYFTKYKSDAHCRY